MPDHYERVPKGVTLEQVFSDVKRWLFVEGTDLEQFPVYRCSDLDPAVCDFRGIRLRSQHYDGPGPHGGNFES